MSLTPVSRYWTVCVDVVSVAVVERYATRLPTMTWARCLFNAMMRGRARTMVSVT